MNKDCLGCKAHKIRLEHLEEAARPIRKALHSLEQRGLIKYDGIGLQIITCSKQAAHFYVGTLKRFDELLTAALTEPIDDPLEEKEKVK